MAAPSNTVTQSLPENAISDSRISGGEGSSSGPAGSSLDKPAPPASPSDDAKEGDEALSSSQESGNRYDHF